MATLRRLQTVVLIVDEGPRDYLGLLLLAVDLVRSGFRVVMSSLDPFRLVEVFPAAVYLGKHGFRRADRFPGVWALHPAEGAFYNAPHWETGVFNKYFLADLAENPPDFFFAWGQHQADFIVSHFPGHSEKTVVTGAQRLDLCLPGNHWVSRHEARSISERYPEFILVATRFTTVMSPAPTAKVSALLKYHSAFSGIREASKVLADQVSLDAVGLGFFVAYLTRLFDEFPDQTFVLRPHPSERADFYQVLFGHYENVVIDQSGNVVPWILCSKAVVTSGSTTAVEAVLSGIPVVNFVPRLRPDGELKVAVASEVGHVVEDVSAGIDTFRRILQGVKPSNPPLTGSVASKLANFNGAARDRILDSLNVLARECELSEMPNKRALRRLSKGRRLLQPLFGFFDAKWDVSKPKRAPLSEAQILDVLEFSRSEFGTTISLVHNLGHTLIFEPAAGEV